MAFNINEIRSQLRYGGARPTLFNVQLNFPQGDPVASRQTPFKIQAASLPATNIGSFSVPYYGRDFKLAGDRTFESWSVTVMVDEDFPIRHAFESWINYINNVRDNIMNTPTGSPLDYKTDGIITQLSKGGQSLRRYVMIGMFPTSVGEITTSWDSTNQIETFPVTFDYDWFEVDGMGATGSVF